jgi:putative peptide zinc metalloprotease protein
MATLAESLISSTSRSLTLRMRPDLSSRKQRYNGQEFWVVKEPVGLNYFRFHEEEFAILCMLDGQSSLEDIKERFETEFTPQKITFQDLQQFVGMLHRSGLVISEATGQGQQLRRRRDKKKRKETFSKFSNVFALRFRGIDPERLLNWMHPYFGWVFSPVARCMALVLALSALSLVAVQFDIFRSRLPSFHEFFGPHNWIYLAVVMGTVKVMHEFGHGLSCKHYGGECHEIGLMLLVFTPCLYCNVSDSWMLPSKWKRAFIGAAGMYVEVVLASIATFLWWFSEHGLLNQLALSVMFICSVSTLLFNGNPLLRFDGYYILMDLLEIPNLRQKSTEVLKRFMAETCLGIEQPENPFLPQNRKFAFAMFTVASVIYRWVVVFGILYFLNKILEPYGLKIIGQLIACVGLFGLVFQPISQLVKFFHVPGRMHKVKGPRVAATVSVIAAIVLTIMYLPLPFHVACTFEVTPQGAESVFVEVPGQLNEIIVEPGDTVEPGMVLARMDNVNLHLAFARLRGEEKRLQAQLDSLKDLRHEDESAVLQIPAIEENLDMVTNQLKEKEEELGRLEIRVPAGIKGVVFPPPVRPKRDMSDGRLPSWSGSPFDDKNKGALLMTGDQICQIGDPQRFEAVLVIDQAHIDLVSQYWMLKREFPEVDVKFDAYRWKTSEARIDKLASAPMEVSPASLTAQGGGELSVKTDQSTGALRPVSTSYQARVPLDHIDTALRVGLTGKAKIYTGWQPLGRRLHRYILRTFHFYL